MSRIRLEWQRNGCDLCCVDINEQREKISSPNDVFFFAGKIQDVFFLPKHNPGKGHDLVTP